MTLRRTFMAACVAMACTLSLAQAPVEIRISTASPDNSALADALRSIKTQMESKFPGALKMSVHTASSLFRQGTEVPALQRGNLEMSTPVTFEIEQQLPEYGVLSSAYLFRDSDHLIKTFRSDIGKEYYADVEKKMDIVILDAAYLGTRNVSLRTDKSIQKPEDLASSKMRMPPGPAFQVLSKALGATPVSMPITEVYLGLKTGSIDGQDNPANMTRDWKFNEVIKQMVMTRHLVQPVFIAMSKSAYDKLTPAQQTELRAATRTAVNKEVAETLADEKSAIESFKAGNIKVVEPDIQAFRTAVAAAYKESGQEAKWKSGLAARVQAIK